jgi:hypothetical protein
VEKKGSLQPRKGSSRKEIAPPTAATSQFGASDYNVYRKWFEGKHQGFSWPPKWESPVVSYAPSKNQMKPWPKEAQIEGWFSNKFFGSTIGTGFLLLNCTTLVPNLQKGAVLVETNGEGTYADIPCLGHRMNRRGAPLTWVIIERKFTTVT